MTIRAKNLGLYTGDKTIAIQRLNVYGQYDTIMNVEKTSYGYENDRNGTIHKTLTDAKQYADKAF